jgi:hypothetical protein
MICSSGSGSALVKERLEPQPDGVPTDEIFGFVVALTGFGDQRSARKTMSLLTVALSKFSETTHVSPRET